MKQWDPTWPQAAHDGSDAAVAALVAHFMPLVRRGARGCICPGLDFEDAVQEGLIGLFSAVRSYRPAAGVPFAAFAAARFAFWSALNFSASASVRNAAYPCRLDISALR